MVEQVINAYTQITSDAEFREIERQRQLASHNEASALNARERKVNMKWQGVVADMGTKLADMSTRLADRDAENERLRAQIAELQAGPTPGN